MNRMIDAALILPRALGLEDSDVPKRGQQGSCGDDRRSCRDYVAIGVHKYTYMSSCEWGRWKILCLLGKRFQNAVG